jgi:hypothetical protein
MGCHLRRFSAKHAGPVKIAILNSDTLVLDTDRTFKWPLVIGLSGVVATCFGIWFPPLVYFFIYYAPLAITSSLCFVLFRAKITLSGKTASLERGPVFSLVRTRRNILRIGFSDIREFLVEAEFELAPEEPFIWQLAVVTNDGTHYPLTWHFLREPVIHAAQEATRMTGKPIREECNPWNTSKWQRRGYNLLS